MKNIYIQSLLLALLPIFGTQLSVAQPAEVRKVDDAVFFLKTYNKEKVLLGVAHGVFVGADGEAFSSWKPFENADSAVVVDNKGREYQVDVITGVNELYDVIKFKVNAKTPFVKIANTPAKAGDKVWLTGYSLKKAEHKQINIKKTETFSDKYQYYLFTLGVTESNNNCPLVNDRGELIGLIQKPFNAEEAHSTDARFINSLTISSGLAVNDPLLRKTNIPLMMPSNEQEALIMLVLSAEQGRRNYKRYAEDFLRLFPTSIEGYTTLSQLFLQNGECQKAQNMMESALKHVKKKDAAHSEYAKIICQQQLFYPDSSFTAWKMDDALEHVVKAYAINPLPSYKHQQAQILFSLQKYNEAYDMFMALTRTSLRNGELFYEAAQCKSQLQAPKEEILVLLDSAVAACQKPLTSISAPIFLARGMALDNAGEYRKALKDYNQYDTLMLGRANADFYFIKYKAETKLHQFQQALDDIAHAALLSPKEPLYLAELASLQLRVNRLEDCIKTANMCLQLAPDMPDIHLIKGLALVQNKQKEEGLKSLEKAKSLGDKRADDYIRQFQ